MSSILSMNAHSSERSLSKRRRRSGRPDLSSLGWSPSPPMAVGGINHHRHLAAGSEGGARVRQTSWYHLRSDHTAKPSLVCPAQFSRGANHDPGNLVRPAVKGLPECGQGPHAGSARPGCKIHQAGPARTPASGESGCSPGCPDHGSHPPAAIQRILTSRQRTCRYERPDSVCVGSSGRVRTEDIR
jgi:hypothetical protein